MRLLEMLCDDVLCSRFKVADTCGIKVIQLGDSRDLVF